MENSHVKFKVLLTTLCILLLASNSFAFDRATTYIRNCNFSKCAYKTVGQSIDEAFKNPQWESGKASDGDLIVNASGIVTWQGKMYKAVIQFQPTPNGFKTLGVAFNGKVMGEDFKNTFIVELCK